MDQVFISLANIIKQITQISRKFFPKKFFKTRIGFQIQIKNGTFFRQYLSQRKCKGCLQTPAKRRKTPMISIVFFNTGKVTGSRDFSSP